MIGSKVVLRYTIIWNLDPGSGRENKEQPLTRGDQQRVCDVLIFSAERFVIKDGGNGGIGGIRHASQPHYKAICRRSYLSPSESVNYSC